MAFLNIYFSAAVFKEFCFIATYLIKAFISRRGNDLTIM